jgi:hypothetical protein
LRVDIFLAHLQLLGRGIDLNQNFSALHGLTDPQMCLHHAAEQRRLDWVGRCVELDSGFG